MEKSKGFCSLEHIESVVEMIVESVCRSESISSLKEEHVTLKPASLIYNVNHHTPVK